MANKKLNHLGETLVRIALQSKLLCDYILDKQSNQGKIQLKTIIEMSNVIVSNVEHLKELDWNEYAKTNKENLN